MKIGGKAGRRPTGFESAPQGREATRPKAWRLADCFATLVAGIAAVLKALLPGAVHIGSPATPGASPTTKSDRPTRVEVGTQPPSESAINAGDDGGICNLSAPDIGFILPDHALLSYAASSGSFGNKLAAFFPAAFGYLPQNDNLPRANPGVRDAEALLPPAAAADLPETAFLTKDTGEPQGGDACHGAQGDAASTDSSEEETRAASGGPAIDQESRHRAARLDEERFDALHYGSNPHVPTGITFTFHHDARQSVVNTDPERDEFYKSRIMLDGIQLPLSIANFVA